MSSTHPRSVAVLALIERVRQWQNQGLPIEVFFFDGQGSKEQTRDQVMAKNVLAKRQARPDAPMLLMMGNLHARKVKGTPWGDKNYQWLSSLLPESTITLNVRSEAGTAWVCRSSTPDACGADVLRATDGALSRAKVTLTQAPTAPSTAFSTLNGSPLLLRRHFPRRRWALTPSSSR